MNNILLVAFGKRGYGLMTHNLALSLKHHSPNVNIHLFITEPLEQHIQKEHFATIGRIEYDEYHDHRGIAPAKIKARIYELGRSIGLESFLYLDVDAICLNPVESFFDELKGNGIATEIIGKGTKKDIINYSIWAKNEDIWDFFKLCDNAILCGIQSSWMYFEHNEVCDKVQEYLSWYMIKGLPLSMLIQTWGGGIPDELLYQGIFAKMGIIPYTPQAEKHTILFGNKQNRTEVSNAPDLFYFLSIYGNDKLTVKKWLKLYDKQLAEIDSLNYYPYDMVMRDKHANLR
jgi:hypothetical protein